MISLAININCLKIGVAVARSQLSTVYDINIISKTVIWVMVNLKRNTILPFRSLLKSQWTKAFLLLLFWGLFLIKTIVCFYIQKTRLTRKLRRGNRERKHLLLKCLRFLFFVFRFSFGPWNYKDRNNLLIMYRNMEKGMVVVNRLCCYVNVSSV